MEGAAILVPVCSNCGSSDFVWADNLRTGTIGRGTLSLRSGGELPLGTRVCRGCGHADLFLKDMNVLRQPHTWRPGEFVPIPSKPAPPPAAPAAPAPVVARVPPPPAAPAAPGPEPSAAPIAEPTPEPAAAAPTASAPAEEPAAEAPKRTGRKKSSKTKTAAPSVIHD